MIEYPIELSHARFSTISRASKVVVYPSVSTSNEKMVDISPFIAAAAQLGSDSGNHASTFEHLVVVSLAYTESAETFPLLANFFNGGTRYSHRPDVTESKCAGVCIVSR